MNESVIKAITLLEELAQRKQPTSLKDLAQRTKLDKATAVRLLSSLVTKGLVQKVRDHGYYALGPKLLTFAEEYRKSFTLRDRVLPHLQKLVEATGETAIYCERLGQDSCVTVERWDSPHETRTFMETGVPRSLCAGSSGLAILATLPQDEVVSILDAKPLQKYTPYSPTSKKQVLEKLEESRNSGYVVSIQERYLYTIGVAAPVCIGQTVVGSLAIIGPAERIKAFGLERTGKVVRAIAEKFSSELTYYSGKKRLGGSAVTTRRHTGER